MPDDVWLESGAGTPVAVFLHGVGGGAKSWRAQLDEFAGRGRCLAWNAPGYGGAPPIEPFDWDALVAALARDLDGLGVRRPALIGHSMGGMIAQAFAARFPERTGALVLSATSPAFGRPDGDWQREFVRQRLAPLDEGIGMDGMAARVLPGLVGPNAGASVRARITAIMSAVPESTYRAAMTNLVTFDGRAHLGAIEAPTWVVAAEHDAMAPAAMMERMSARIPGARFSCIDDAGHLAPMERPAAFGAALRDLFEHPEAPTWT